MKKIITIIILIIIISLPAIFLFAAGPGTSAANFLKLGVGARAVGMGESFAAVADDVTSVYWNPAGLSRIKGTELHVSHNIWFQDINYEFVGVGIPLGKRTDNESAIPFSGVGSKGVFAVSANYLYLDGIERRSGNTAEPEGEFGANDLAVTLTYAGALNFLPISNLNGGINIKTIRQQIDNKRAQAYAADFGFQLRTGQIVSGFAVQNIGTKMKFLHESYPLPLNYKFGIAWQPLGTVLNIALDINKPIDNKLNYHIGTEYWVGQVIALRTGYLHRDLVQKNALTGKGFGTNNNSELIGLTGLMAGAGFRILGYGLDYAFVPYGELGNTHRVSLNMKF